MDIRQNPLWLSIPLGTYFRTDVKVSVWFLLIGLLLWANLGIALGTIVTCILFVSLLLHEFAHVWAARKTDGSGSEILIWPLGGLAFVTPAPNYFSEFWTTLAGPLTHLGICLLCLPVVISGHVFWESLSLLSLPPIDLKANFPQALVLLTFSVNLQLMVLNLLPIYPLDGGQLAYYTAKLKWDRQQAKTGTLWAGMILALLLSTLGVALRSTELVFLGAILMVLCNYEHMASQMSRPMDDSFMGYDFSQGYTSLEHREEAESRPGMIERWRQQRAQRKHEKEMQTRLETERRVDELLEKVHQHGMGSLTDSERRFLQRASGRYRSHDKE